MAATLKDLEELISFAEKNGLMEKPFDEVYELYLKQKQH